MKKGTKVLVLTFLSLVIISILVGCVSAASIAQQAGEAARNLFVLIGAFASGLFGIANIPLQRLYLGILLIMVIYSVVKDLFSMKERVAWAASIIIAILGVGLLPEDLINAITVQYGAMGAAILTVIPFMIMLFFTLSIKNLLVARVAWMFYVVYYFILYISAWVESESINWFYIGAVLIGLIIFFGMKFFRSLLTGEKLSAVEEQAMIDIQKRGLVRKRERKGYEQMERELK